MKRIVLWFLSTLSVVLLLFGYHTSTSSSLPAGSQPAVVSGTVAGGSRSTSTASRAPAPSSSTKKAPKAKAPVTATVTGAVANTRWGPVQVQLDVASGQISKVSVVQYPNGNSRDAQINSYALPILIQETTSAQSAHIDMVSGASYTSEGYLQSLQSALDKANL